MDQQRRESLWRAIAALPTAPGQTRCAYGVCAATVSVLESLDAAVLTLRSESRAQEVLGSNDEWAADLGALQYLLGEGPGVEAFATGRVVLVPDLGAEAGRWPGFAGADRARRPRGTRHRGMGPSGQEVNMATGMLAAQLRISLDDAFLRLRAHAFTEGRPVIDVARDVLERRIRLDTLAD